MSFSDSLSIADNGNLIWRDLKHALGAMAKWERHLHIFWLLGPFILLIERSPADLWLTVLALSFAVRSVILRQGAWLRVFWVKAAFAFWGVTLLSALVSQDPSYAFGEAFVWFRFPLFAMATMFWLGTDKRLLYAMMASTALALIVMCGILSAELLIEGQKGGRLSWPYGDVVPGNYVAKVGLPVFTVMVALAVSANGRIAVISGIISLFTMLISVMTGERINFLVRACAGMLAGLLWRPKWVRYGSLVLIEIAAVLLLFAAAPDTGNRYVSKFIQELPTGEHSIYYNTMKPGYMAFEQAPILGIGTGNFRNMCEDIVGDEPKLRCHPHPHNFYIQMLGETGIIGFIFGTIFLWSIIVTCFRAGWRHKDNVILATAWVVPFGLFWPIASTADFFGQWNNIFMWSAVALALAANNLSGEKTGS